MERTNAEVAIKELTMLLMYLTRFSEKDRFYESVNNAWKGYDFDIVNELDEEEYISQGSHHSKSVHINEKRLSFANELLEKYNISDWERIN